MNIPTIGGAQGIFEIFVPGMFLLLNLAVVVYLFPFTDNPTKEALVTLSSNTPLILVIAITFGYLVGILLRLFSPELPDKYSTLWMKSFNPKVRIRKNTFRLSVTDPFPYIEYLGEVCSQYLPPDAEDFYQKVWRDRKKTPARNKTFLNFCKVIINSGDKMASTEIYIAESMTRYISGMFYALVLSCFAILFTLIFQRLFYGQAMIGLIVLFLAYLLCIWAIVRRFRDIRIKEVETVFAASFKNRDLFLPKDQQQPTISDKTSSTPN